MMTAFSAGETEPRRQPLRLARVVQGHDVRVREPCGYLDLAQQALRAEGGGEIRPQDLDGDLPVVAHVFGQEHGRHAARAELALDHVAIGERDPERFADHRPTLATSS
jgi:hypothetical protein